jgi:hypothetical protein
VRKKTKRRIFIVVSLFVLFLYFHQNLSFAQQTQKTQNDKQQKSGVKIVIEYISFPDTLKRYAVYPWETLKVEEFRKAYSEMLGQKSREEWISSLTGTGNQNRMLNVFKTHLILIASCKPHFCDESQVLILYNPVSKKCFAIYAEDGKFDYLGAPDKNIKNLLKILLVEEYKDIYKAQ